MLTTIVPADYRTSVLRPEDLTKQTRGYPLAHPKMTGQAQTTGQHSLESHSIVQAYFSENSGPFILAGLEGSFAGSARLENQRIT